MKVDGEGTESCVLTEEVVAKVNENADGRFNVWSGFYRSGFTPEIQQRQRRVSGSEVERNLQKKRRRAWEVKNATTT
jgi:hypothetical protein